MNITQQTKFLIKTTLILNYITIAAAFRVLLKYYLLQLSMITFLPIALCYICIV